MRWEQFEALAPEISAAGKRLLYAPDAPEQGEVGLLATVDAGGTPRIAPVCPIFCTPGIYLLVARKTPKCAHLASNGMYALHALIGASDEEFQISGTVRAVTSIEERAVVIEAIPFPAYDPNDPIFELLIDRALNVSWPTPGKSVRRAWPVRSRSG